MDDPYAQWWLVKIEDALEGSARVIEDLRQQVEARLKGSPGFEATIAESLEPVRVPLKFANPYAYQAARLIIAFDDLMRAILTARHVGIMGREETEKTANLGGRAVRRALNSGLGYKLKMISRKDIDEGNAKAVEARELMGQLPQEIHDRSLQAKHAPEPASSNRPGATGYFGLEKRTLQSTVGVAKEEVVSAAPPGDDTK
jgi:integrating conjugative element protein (TIGR03761 family)